MAQDRYSGFPASFVHAGGTLNLTQLIGGSVRTGKQRSEIIAGGDVDRKAVGLSHADPQQPLTTQDLSTLLGTVSLTTGLSCTSGSTFRLQKRLNGGTFATGGSHMTVTSGKGFLAIESIQAQQDDVQGAVAELLYYPLWEGVLGTPPLVPTTGVNFAAAPAPAYVSHYYLGPVYVGSTQLEGVRGVTINSGLGYVYKRADGDPWARLGSIYTRRPTISINFEKISNITSAALFSAAIADDVHCYFALGVHGGTRTSFASAVHLKVSATVGEWGTEDIQWREEEDASTTIMITPTDALSVSTASTIP